jgi:hypothetical protein
MMVGFGAAKAQTVAASSRSLFLLLAIFGDYEE